MFLMCVSTLGCSRSMASVESVSVSHTSTTSVSIKSLKYRETGVDNISHWLTTTSMRSHTSQRRDQLGRKVVLDTHTDDDSFGVDFVQRKQSVENTSDGKQLHQLCFADGFCKNCGTGDEGFEQTVIHITATPGNNVQFVDDIVGLLFSSGGNFLDAGQVIKALTLVVKDRLAQTNILPSLTLIAPIETVGICKVMLPIRLIHLATKALLHGVNTSTHHQFCEPYYSLVGNSCSAGPQLITKAIILSKITSGMPSTMLSKDIVKEFAHLKLADPPFHVLGPIDIFLGADTRQTALQRLFVRIRGVMRRRHPLTFQYRTGQSEHCKLTLFEHLGSAQFVALLDFFDLAFVVMRLDLQAALLECCLPRCRSVIGRFEWQVPSSGRPL
uniref:Uncharacterized protein n=1 Tax=Timema genevievae TaxID=629358 RepID=A0A7R9JXR1_TIMGE|nr:unnamed protein product [Timema genevievae]